MRGWAGFGLPDTVPLRATVWIGILAGRTASRGSSSGSFLDGLCQHPESRAARSGASPRGAGHPVVRNRHNGPRRAVFLAEVRAHGNGFRRFDERLRAVACIDCRRGELVEDLAAPILAVWTGKFQVVFPAAVGFAGAIFAVRRMILFCNSR